MLGRTCLILVGFALVFSACGSRPATPVSVTTPTSEVTGLTSPIPDATPVVTPTPDPLEALFDATAAPTPPRTLQEGVYVDVGGYRMYIRCEGEGSPTVVMESNLGGIGAYWHRVYPGVSEFSRACVYDRAGRGSSQAGPTPRTFRTIVGELHTLLGNAGIEGPYVLVGLDISGLMVRLYAHRYPDEVAGMVLIDALNEDIPARLLATLPPKKPGEDEAVTGWRRDLERFVDPKADPSEHPEGLRIAESLAQVRASGDLGDRPLVVLTHGRGGAWSPELPAGGTRRFEREWQRAQVELARLSSDSVHVFAQTREGNIHEQQPELVVEAIRQVVQAVRKGKPLPPCGKSIERLGGKCAAGMGR